MPGAVEMLVSSLSAAEETPSTSASVKDEHASASSQGKKPASVVLDQSVQENVTQSELLWAMKVAHSGYSYSSCEDTPPLFKTMFLDSIISEWVNPRCLTLYQMDWVLTIGRCFVKTLARNQAS